MFALSLLFAFLGFFFPPLFIVAFIFATLSLFGSTIRVLFKTMGALFGFFTESEEEQIMRENQSAKS